MPFWTRHKGNPSKITRGAPVLAFWTKYKGNRSKNHWRSADFLLFWTKHKGNTCKNHPRSADFEISFWKFCLFECIFWEAAWNLFHRSSLCSLDTGPSSFIQSLCRSFKSLEALMISSILSSCSALSIIFTFSS